MKTSEKIHGALINRMINSLSKVSDSDLKVWYDETARQEQTNAATLEALEHLIARADCDDGLPNALELARSVAHEAKEK